MKRLVQNQMYNSIHDSDYQGWKYGIRNTGKNLGGLGNTPCNYYIIADSNQLRS